VERAGLIPVVRQYWGVLLAVAVLAGGLGLLATSQAGVSYQGEARVLVGPINGDKITLDAATQLAQTYAELATSQPQLDAAASRLGGKITVEELRDSLAVTADEATRLITVRATASNPGLANNIANEAAVQLTLISPPDPNAPAGGVLIVDRSLQVEAPSQSKFMVATVAAVFGAMCALAAATLLLATSKLVRTAPRLRAVTGWEIITSVASPLSLDYPLSDPGRAGDDASFRRMAAFVDHRVRSQEGRSIVVAGVGVGDDGLGVAIQLAATLDRSGHRVVLLLSGGIPHSSGVQAHLGGLDVQVRSVNLADPLNPIVDHVMAREMLATCDGDLVVVAAEPVNESGETLAWATVADSVVVVASFDRLMEREARDAASAMRIVNANVDGVVLVVEKTRRRAWTRRWGAASEPALAPSATPT